MEADKTFWINELVNIFDDVDEAIKAYNQLDENGVPVKAFVEYYNENVDGAFEALRYCADNYEGKHSSWEDFAYSLVEAGCFGNVSDALISYIDWKKLSDDIAYDFTMTESGYTFSR